MSTERFKITRSKLLQGILILATVGITVAWLRYTPDGLLGKMDAIGYAVCHRIELRSFHLGERALPLCARCSGMHLAALLGLVYQIQFGRKGKMPPQKIWIVLGLLAAAFVLDGLNSYLHFFPNAPWAYDPHNWLRLVTGSGLGLAIAAVIYPVANLTLWKDWQDQAALSGWKQFTGLAALVALLDVAILCENPIVLYPLAILSGLAVLTILTLCYALLITILAKKENHYSNGLSAWVPLCSGFAIAVFQTYIIDILRYTFTATWGGFIL